MLAEEGLQLFGECLWLFFRDEMAAMLHDLPAFAPEDAAAEYGVSARLPWVQLPASSAYPRLYEKGLRDLVLGKFIFILLDNRAPHRLCAFMAAVGIISAWRRCDRPA